MDEPALIRLFVDLTGETESNARSVVMYLDMLERDYFPASHPLGVPEIESDSEPVATESTH